MDEIKKAVNGAIDLMEKDNRGVQLGCYSVALVGLGVAVRRVRPFSRFRKPSDIPNHFIQEKRELTGLVERIEPNGGLLMIRHKPLIAIPGTPGGQLPVKISGVRVSGLGLTWLQTIVVGNEVKFIPLAKAQNFVQCQVLLPQITRKKKQHDLNLGESLVRIGFGHVTNIEKPIASDKSYLTYYNRLQVAENYALRKKLGMKYYMQPLRTALIFILKNVQNVVYGTYKQIIQIPKMPTS